jgi:hypothetical protein
MASHGIPAAANPDNVPEIELPRQVGIKPMRLAPIATQHRRDLDLIKAQVARLPSQGEILTQVVGMVAHDRPSPGSSHPTRRWREMDSNPRSPVTWQGRSFTPIIRLSGGPGKKRLKRMLDGFMRDGVAPSAGSAHFS